MMAPMDEVMTPVLTVTNEARAKILEARADETGPESLALFLAVSGESDGAYTYSMEFRPLADAVFDDLVQRHDDLPVVIAAGSIDRVTGATLDFTGVGMVMQNPNRPDPASAGDRPAGDLSSPVAQSVLGILETQINPSIAAHGGRADLVAVEDGVVYVRMSGGCQGCGLAGVTLSQGIEVAILEALPELTRVVDVTDHASGDNPYYEAAKK